MNNFTQIIESIEQEIDTKNRIKEKVLRVSRTIIIYCRKAIQYLHQNKLSQASDLLHQVEDLIMTIHSETQNYPDMYSAGFFENAAQEYAEAVCFFSILQQKPFPDPTDLHITHASYLMGLCDVVGELRRKTLDSIIKGDFDKSNDFLDIMETIYEGIIRFDYPSSLVPIKRKQDVARQLIEKTRGELAVASCEHRINRKTEELQKSFHK